MSLFVDASALVAMIAGEAEKREFAISLRDTDDVLWSAMSCWEAISGLRTSYGWSLLQARSEVESTASRFRLRLIPIGERERVVALDAYDLYGRGSGHPAKLNFGDCFAYACAKTNGARLLYKGNDFARTDLR